MTIGQPETLQQLSCIPCTAGQNIFFQATCPEKIQCYGCKAIQRALAILPDRTTFSGMPVNSDFLSDAAVLQPKSVTTLVNRTLHPLLCLL